MPRPKKQKIEVNSGESLQSVMQEVYNDACSNITASQTVINELSAGSTPTDIDDITKIAKAKTDALKVKDSAIKIKLDVGKLQSDIIKHGGDVVKASDENPEIVGNDAFDKIRKLIAEKKALDKKDE